MRLLNPHIDFFDSHHWGYSVVKLTSDECRVVAYAVDKTENRETADRNVLVAYRVPDRIENLGEY
jgi:alkaline phosphatase D